MELAKYAMKHPCQLALALFWVFTKMTEHYAESLGKWALRKGGRTWLRNASAINERVKEQGIG